MRPVPPLYIVQVAQLGGGKLGVPDDPEGAWTDNDVYLTREEAQAQATLYETAERMDGDLNVVSTARVVTLHELHEEFGLARSSRFTTMFRDRINELVDQHYRQRETSD